MRNGQLTIEDDMVEEAKAKVLEEFAVKYSTINGRVLHDPRNALLIDRFIEELEQIEKGR